MAAAPGRAPRRSPDEALAAVEGFLHACREPTLIEPGEPPLLLRADNVAVWLADDRLNLQAWNAETNLARRVLDVGDEADGRLELQTEHFAKRRGTLLLVDTARAKARAALTRAGQDLLRDQFRRVLARARPAWRVEHVSAAPELEHSLSPAYPRAVIEEDGRVWAAIGPGAGGRDAERALTYGLTWLDYVRRHERERPIAGLALFVSRAGAVATRDRLGCLDTARGSYLLHACTADGHAELVDLADCGNLDTTLDDRRDELPTLPVWAREFASLPDVQAVELPRGGVSWRVRGVEFARWDGEVLRYGLETRRLASESNLPELLALARELAERRRPGGDPRGEWYRRAPERWLEAWARDHLERLDPTLRDAPVYGQVPSWAGSERGVADLLAVGRDGRLAVLELKASEDIHLPMQALDYWRRVRWHLERGEFAARGYFPGVALSPEPPRLLLVSPALQFHPATEAILRCFAPEIEVERIGLNEDWRREPRVVMRLRGAERPRT